MKKRNIFSGKITQKNIDRVIAEMAQVGGKMKTLVKYAKNKFDQADEKTKRKIFKGLAGATAVLAALIGARRFYKGKKRK